VIRVAVVAFDSLGTLFDLGELEERMPRVLHHALSLTVVGEWAPLDELAAALDPELAQRLPGLDPYDDALTALERVRASGAEAWVLTNGGLDSTRKLLERAGLARAVAEIRSAEEVERYKPHPAVYELLPTDAVLVAAHAWDVAGVLATGRGGVWVDRADQGWPLPGPQPQRVRSLREAALVASGS
jgi:2-haloacid dehalogenase